MKKTLWLALILLLVCVFALSACDDGDTPQTPNDTPSGTTDSTTESETDAHVHAFGEWTTVKDATCTVKGEQERSCSCGEKEAQSIDATGHTEVIDAAVAATCTTDGKTEGKHCSVCETILIAQETVPSSHDWAGKYGWDKDVHWQICSTCEHTSSPASHTLGSDGYCTVCDNPLAGSDGVLYFPSADGTYAEVVDYVGSSTRVVIADTYEGVPVTKIGGSAFKNKSITSVYIPDSVTSIGEWAFYDCSSLTSITFGENSQLTSIGDHTFENCSNLTSVDFGDNSQLTRIGYRAFYDCPNLTSVDFGDNSQLTSIDSSAFFGCSILKSITIPDSVTSIYPSSFEGCTTLIEIVGGVSYIGDILIDFDGTAVSVDVRDGTRVIAHDAFRYSQKLRSITIPNTVMFVGDSAFYGCSNLAYNAYDNGYYLGNDYNPYLILANVKNTSITSCEINSKTVFICNAFYGCSNLASITIPDSVTSIGAFSFYGCSNLASITIPDSVTSIGSTAFYECSSLTSITIPDSVTSIGNDAFAYCDSLTSITIPDSVTSIGSYAFYGCSDLVSVDFGNNSQLTSISSNTFSNCYDITIITIPDSVTSIGDSAFYHCTNLKSINFEGTMKQWNAIPKGNYWNYKTGDYTIHCTDGNI